MSIVRFYKITCDTCGKIEEKMGIIKTANRLYKKTGGKVIGNRHFCCLKCYESFIFQLKPKNHKGGK